MRGLYISTLHLLNLSPNTSVAENTNNLDDGKRHTRTVYIQYQMENCKIETNAGKRKTDTFLLSLYNLVLLCCKRIEM